MTRLCRDKNALAHDDRLDAVAMAVAHFVEMMDVNDEDRIMEITEEELDKWLNVSVIEEFQKEDTRQGKQIKALRELK